MASILERNKNIKPKKKTREEYAEDALYREVWEDVNNEKTLRFLKKYQNYIIGAVAGIVIVVSGIQLGVRAYHDRKIATAINYEDAIESVDARALASMGRDGAGATADLALFQSYVLDKNVENLKYLAEHGNTRDFRDLAALHVVSIDGDEMDAGAVEKYLSGLNTKSSPYYYVSRLMVAQKYLSVGDRANANKWLDKIINDSDAPATISATAQTLR